MSVKAVHVSGLCCVLFVVGSAWAADQLPVTGPETEKRFPRLKVPPGFRATLFACDPLVEYPSAIALGPKSGTLFVAVDYLTGLGTDLVRRDEIRLLQDTNGDGYADQSTVYATGFNSIQGLAYHDGTVYAMHAPLLTALEDVDGDGVADKRRDLLTGLGLTPEENPPRLHCANGVVMGHDGWLYLALGDHGCKVRRPEGDGLVLEGGGILRCRRDGADLHVFASGLRNIYDVALDEELNVFVRDNENDGGDYKIRVCHSFFGADHGYPYLYYERPAEALPPLADLGLGSSAGGLVYLEDRFPPEYRGNLFFCEWGRAVVRYRPNRAGSTFAPVREIDFAAGAETDPYGFKPTDLVVDRDGSLVVADWADGQRPRRGRGRIYRIAYAGETGAANTTAPTSGAGTPVSKENSGPQVSTRPTGARGSLADWISQLDAEGYLDRVAAQTAIGEHGSAGISGVTNAIRQRQMDVRGRLHAVWLVAGWGRDTALAELFRLAKEDPNARVRAQAIRALGDLSDPVLVHDRLDAGPASSAIASRLAGFGSDPDPRVRLEAVVAAGRLGWPNAPEWLRGILREPPDAALAHAAMQTLRRSQNWAAVLELVDLADTEPVRSIALRAVAGRYDSSLVSGLIGRLATERGSWRRREYAGLLARVYKKPGMWVYWGYRPPPRPAGTIAWERTDAIEGALNGLLGDADRSVRAVALRQMQREKVPTRAAMLADWLREEREPDAVAALVESLAAHPGGEARETLATVVRDRDHANRNRLLALAALERGADPRRERQVVRLSASLEDGPVLAAALRVVVRLRREASQKPETGVEVGRLPAGWLVEKLRSTHPEVRTAAVEYVAELQVTDAGELVRDLLGDCDAGVRRAAAGAAGKLLLAAATESLLRMARDGDADVRRASLDSLRLLRERRVVPLAVAALTDRETQPAALQCIRDLGGPAQASALIDLAKRTPSDEIVTAVVHALAAWAGQEPPSSRVRIEVDRAIAEVQGSSGALVRWMTVGPVTPDIATEMIGQATQPQPKPQASRKDSGRWRIVLAARNDARIQLGREQGAAAGSIWLASTEVAVPNETVVEFSASGNGTLQAIVNGRPIHERTESGAVRPAPERFQATLAGGVNRVLVQITSPQKTAEFYVRYRPRASTPERERWIEAALSRTGSAERGRKLFFDADKSQCVRCHRIGEQGERIGPDLTGVGRRFSRIYIAESILEPSRTIAPSFDSATVALKDGRVLTGVRIAETDTSLTLADNQAQKHVLAKSDVDEQRIQSTSIMPEGLEQRFTPDEFVDLIAFLVSQK